MEYSLNIFGNLFCHECPWFFPKKCIHIALFTSCIKEVYEAGVIFLIEEFIDVFIVLYCFC